MVEGGRRFLAAAVAYLPLLLDWVGGALTRDPYRFSSRSAKTSSLRLKLPRESRGWGGFFQAGIVVWLVPTHHRLGPELLSLLNESKSDSFTFDFWLVHNSERGAGSLRGKVESSATERSQPIQVIGGPLPDVSVHIE